jgi:nitroimidazol reductase NimA-like FMN-containing flavoprotein (pyridoxamine 5'-phosphate oxidase superfamily)
MAARTDRNGLEILDWQACLDLLATVAIGRLAYVTGGVARVIPLNVAPDGEGVLFRLSTGNALAAIQSGQLVTVEADEFDRETCCGWSVAVTGVATEIPAARAVEPAERCHSWLRGTVGRVFRLPTDQVEGRRLPPEAAPGALRGTRSGDR